MTKVGLEGKQQTCGGGGSGGWNINKGTGFSNERTSLTIPTISYPKTILSYPKPGENAT